MALQTTSAPSPLLKLALSGPRPRSRIAAAMRAVWGTAAGLLFLLAFPLALVLAPLLWAVGKVRGDPDLD